MQSVSSSDMTNRIQQNDLAEKVISWVYFGKRCRIYYFRICLHNWAIFNKKNFDDFLLRLETTTVSYFLTENDVEINEIGNHNNLEARKSLSFSEKKGKGVTRS